MHFAHISVLFYFNCLRWRTCKFEVDFPEILMMNYKNIIYFSFKVHFSMIETFSRPNIFIRI